MHFFESNIYSLPFNKTTIGKCSFEKVLKYPHSAKWLAITASLAERNIVIFIIRIRYLRCVFLMNTSIIY